MLTYHVGDLFTAINKPNGRVIIIVHVCNDIGVMGSGFVVPLANKFPLARERYIDAFRNKKFCRHTHTSTRLGNVQWVPITDGIFEIQIAHMIAQQGTISDDNLIPLKYSALTKCMENVAEFARRCDFLAGHGMAKPQIHGPLFGSALAGGSWNFIEILIKEIWGDLDVHIHQLPGQELREVTLA